VLPGVRHAPILMGAVPASSKFWDPYKRLYDLALTKFRMVTHMREERVSSHSSHLGERSPSVPKIFGTSYIVAHSMRNQILYGDQSRCEGNIYRVDHAPCTGQIFGDANSDARVLFAVANLFVTLDYVVLFVCRIHILKPVRLLNFQDAYHETTTELVINKTIFLFVNLLCSVSHSCSHETLR